MSDYTSKIDKINARLDSLYKKHRDLDEQIKKEFDKFSPDSIIKHMKQEKLHLKGEINHLEEEVKAIK